MKQFLKKLMANIRSIGVEGGMSDQVKLYRSYGERLLNLQQGAVDWGMDHKRELLRTAKKLGMLGANDTLIFDSDSELSILMDGLIYETRVEQQKIVAAFLKQYICKDDIDQQLADAMRQAQFGLYRIEAITSDHAAIQLKALVAGIADTTITNVALSESARTGMVIASRILRLPALSIASGVFFAFESAREQRVVREWWKFQGLERYAHIFRLSLKEPIQTAFV
jgi:hypothetical protein